MVDLPSGTETTDACAGRNMLGLNLRLICWATLWAYRRCRLATGL